MRGCSICADEMERSSLISLLDKTDISLPVSHFVTGELPALDPSERSRTKHLLQFRALALAASHAGVLPIKRGITPDLTCPCGGGFTGIEDDEPLLIIEPGAGKAGLASIVTAFRLIEPSRLSVALIETGSGYQAACDGRMKKRGATVFRALANAADVDFKWLNDNMGKGKAAVMGKHLCGGCTDFALVGAV